jgi:hypothetical protein
MVGGRNKGNQHHADRDFLLAALASLKPKQVIFVTPAANWLQGATTTP